MTGVVLVLEANSAINRYPINTNSVTGHAMPPTYQRTLSRKVSEFTVVASEVDRYCAENCLSNALRFNVRLALEELILNLIDHATGSRTDRIDVQIELQPGRAVMTVEDDSDPFDPRSAPPFDKAKPLAERGPRGMGIHLVRTMAQDITYERIESRNRLRIVIAD